MWEFEIISWPSPVLNVTLFWLVAVLWNVQGDCENYMVLKGHRNAVVDLSWSGDGTHIVSASPDKTVRAWDAITGKQVHISPSQVFWWFDAI